MVPGSMTGKMSAIREGRENDTFPFPLSQIPARTLATLLKTGCDMSRGNIILAALLWAIIAFLIIYPVSILVTESFNISGTDSWGPSNYLEFFKDTYYLKVFGLSLIHISEPTRRTPI